MPLPNNILDMAAIARYMGLVRGDSFCFNRAEILMHRSNNLGMEL